MLTYLALGDSYTIGEQVAAEENFPHQAVAILKDEYNIDIAPPKIIAVTGWTTDELNAAIKEENIQEHFDIVTLLIGVNNQYRGRDTENYETEFRDLLNQAIAFANGRMSHIFVLSIPDWGITPFAEGKDRTAIAQQIDAYNKINKEVTFSLSCNYIEITESTRSNGLDELYLTPDKLHYAGKEYKIWAEKLAKSIAEKIN
jgi:lysophospholipase L1-like esterase